MKYTLIIALILFLGLEIKGQTVKSFSTDIKLSEIKIYHSISLNKIEECGPSLDTFFANVNGVVSQEKVEYDLWRLKKNEDEFLYVNTSRDENGWDLSMITLKTTGSSLSIKGTSFEIGEPISKLNTLYPDAYARRGLNVRNNTYCSIIDIPKLNGGITFTYNPQSGKITKILFVQLLH